MYLALRTVTSKSCMRRFIVTVLLGAIAQQAHRVACQRVVLVNAEKLPHRAVICRTSDVRNSPLSPPVARRTWPLFWLIAGIGGWTSCYFVGIRHIREHRHCQACTASHHPSCSTSHLCRLSSRITLAHDRWQSAELTYGSQGSTVAILCPICRALNGRTL